MAKPDLDDGWFKFAHELFAALLAAGLSPRCQIVMREVIYQMYGPLKLRDATLCPTEIAARAGLRREHVWHAIDDLKGRGILTQRGVDTYRIQKDYEKWEVRNPSLKGYAEKAREQARTDAQRQRGHARAGLKARADNGTTGTEMPVPTVPESALLAQSESCQPCQNRHADSAEIGTQRVPESARAHIEEPARKKDVEDKEKDVVEERPTRPLDPSQSEIDRVSNWAESLGPNGLGALQCLGSKVAQFATSYPLEWMEAAILKGVAADAKQVWRYAHKLLDQWWSRGRPDEGDMTAARNHRPTPSSPAPAASTKAETKARNTRSMLERLRKDGDRG